MFTGNKGIRYDEDFKRTLVNLYQSGGKSQAALCKEYGIAPMTLNRWIKQYSTVQTDDGKVLTLNRKKSSKTKCSTGRRTTHLKKSDCHLHATLKQRLEAVHKLRLQHDIKTDSPNLC